MQATFDTGDRFALHTELAGKPHLGPAQCPTPRSQQSAQPVVDVVAGRTLDSRHRRILGVPFSHIVSGIPTKII